MGLINDDGLTSRYSSQLRVWSPRRLVLACVICLSNIGAWADDWVWTKGCVATARIECEAWFNSRTTLDQIAVSVDGRPLQAEFKTFKNLGTPASGIWYVSTDGFAQDELGRLKAELQRVAESSGAHLRQALYLAGEPLMVLAPLGSGDFRQKINHIQIRVAPHPMDQVRSLIEILGGAPDDRRALFWIARDFKLSQGQAEALAAELERNKVRLVAIRLMASELDVNSSSPVEMLAAASKGYHDRVMAPDWGRALGSAGGYLDNGGRIAAQSAGLCGRKTLRFDARADGATIPVEGEWTGELAPCSAPSTTPAPQARAFKLTVDTIPASASVTFVNTSTTYRPNIELPAGTYRVRVEAPGHEPKEVEIRLEEDLSKRVELTPLPVPVDDTVHLTVTTQAPNATITIEGQNAPYSAGMPLPAGTYRVRVEASGYVPRTVEVQLTRDETVNVSLEPSCDPRTAEGCPCDPATGAHCDSGQPMILWAAGAGMLLSALAVIWLLRSGRGPRSIKVYGYLIEQRYDGEKRYPLDKSVFTVGRDASCNLVLTDEAVSTVHATLRRDRSGKVTLRDLNSLNGTVVAGEEVAERELQGGESIEMGNTTFRFERSV